MLEILAWYAKVQRRKAILNDFNSWVPKCRNCLPETFTRLNFILANDDVNIYRKGEPGTSTRRVQRSLGLQEPRV